MFEPLSVYPAIAITIVALGLLYVLNLAYKVPLKDVKYPAIDGLRGYLAFAVFLYHAGIYYFYLRTGLWESPASKLYSHFGSSSVLLFFMITGFLFTSKLIEHQSQPVNWLSFYTSRFLRLYPAFILLTITQLILIFWLSDFTLLQPLSELIKAIGQLILFSIPGYTPVNNFNDTGLTTAKVIWTLKYECAFYLSLPALSLLLSKHKPKISVIIITLLVLLIILYQGNFYTLLIYVFTLGMAVAYLAKNKTVKTYAVKPLWGIASLLCLLVMALFFKNPYSVFSITILAVPFACIACGNTFFGLLTLPISRLFGQISYSIYLLHGTVLYIAFTIIPGKEMIKHASSLNHWLITGLSACVVIILSLSSFKWIESPCMAYGTKIARAIKKQIP